MGGNNKIVEIDETFCTTKVGISAGSGSSVGLSAAVLWKATLSSPSPEMHGCMRDRQTLERHIKKWVLEGTTIVTDNWESYNPVSEIPGYNYTHTYVNHEQNYINR